MSCEDELRQLGGEFSRSKGEDDDGQAKVGGTVGSHTTKTIFKESPIGSSDSQWKSCPPITEEECKGQTAISDFDLGFLSANACTPVCNSSHALADLGKVVVEIESNFAHTTTRYGLGQERTVEAQLGKERVRNPAHAQDGAGAFGSGSAKEFTLCEEGSAYLTSGFLGARTEGNKQKEDHNALSEGNWVRNSPVESSLVTKKREDHVQNEKAASQGSSEGDNVAGGTSTKDVAMHIPGLFKSPPRQRKVKGLTELGESSSIPRRSARISKRQSLSESLPHLRGGKNSPSISNGDINNCNLRICDQGTGAKPFDLWDIGKLACLACQWDEKEVVKEYLCMEERNTEFVKGVKEGDKDGSFC